MQNLHKSERFRQLVENKFQIYNSLFMSLPYDKMSNIGMMLPFLYEESREGYARGKSPEHIVEEFFEKHLPVATEAQKHEFLFKIIQYIERQVVLFDSIEDAAFAELHSENDAGTVQSLYKRAVYEHQMPEVKEKMIRFGVRVVFTAHPTQFYPNAVQRILQDLKEAIHHDDITEIDLLLQQLGKTPFVNRERPTPLDEALSIIFYLRNVYYDTVGELYKKARMLFGTSTFTPAHDLIQLGFWPGGDRDGNPFVTAETTLKVAQELRRALFKNYYNTLKNIRRKLSFRGVDQVLERFSDELYRNIFNGDSSLDKSRILNYLAEAQQLIDEKHNGLFRELLEDFRDRVEIFGTHFATLDMRQDSRVHQHVADAVLALTTGAKAGEMNTDEKTAAFLNAGRVSAEDFDDEMVLDTLRSVAQIREIQQKNGERGMFRYIISNSDHVKDVLNVFAFFRLCGYADNEINMDIVPLFETMEGLSNAPEVMQQLYAHPLYREHLERRGLQQTIMLGFSDGTKDGGYLKANWEIYRAKELLTKISADNGVEVVFFDGRGGPPARGGGKTHDFYASQGETIANNRIEITIQGQTITSVFGNKEQAQFNFEQLLTAGLENGIFKDEKKNLNLQQRTLLDELSNLSYKKYTALKSHPSFVPYLAEMSTLPYYGKANIGSRPSKRGSGELKFEDLRAIPFVGSWSQLKQNVPGFFGFGSALKEIQDRGRFGEIKQLYQQSDFFKTLVLNSMMSMSKTYFPLTSYMQKHPVFGEFWNILHDEFQLSKEMMLELTGFKMLMQEEPLSRKSIRIREKIVLPLLSIQQYALIKLQQETEDREVFEKLVTRSLFGNINASRNSA